MEIFVRDQVICWILGEYHHLCQSHSLEEIASWLCDLMTQVVDKRTAKTANSQDLGTRAWVLAALQSMQAHSSQDLPGVSGVVMRWEPKPKKSFVSPFLYSNSPLF